MWVITGIDRDIQQDDVVSERDTARGSNERMTADSPNMQKFKLKAAHDQPQEYNL